MNAVLLNIAADMLCCHPWLQYLRSMQVTASHTFPINESKSTQATLASATTTAATLPWPLSASYRPPAIEANKYATCLNCCPKLSVLANQSIAGGNASHLFYCPPARIRSQALLCCLFCSSRRASSPCCCFFGVPHR